MSDTTRDGSYSPEIRQLAYAMESMNFNERCAAIYNLADKQHRIGMKNGRFGYLPQSEVIAVLERLESKSVEFNVDFINGTSEPAVEMKYIKQEKQNYAKQ